MKSIFSVFLFFILAYTVQGAPSSIHVQCKIPGPVYSGTIDFEQDLTKWKPASSCEEIQPGANIYYQELYIPPFTMKFNGLTYESKPEDTFGEYLEGGCHWSAHKGTIHFPILEETSQIDLEIWANMIDSGKFPNQFTVANDEERCAVRVISY